MRKKKARIIPYKVGDTISCTEYYGKGNLDYIRTVVKISSVEDYTDGDPYSDDYEYHNKSGDLEIHHCDVDQKTTSVKDRLNELANA